MNRIKLSMNRVRRLLAEARKTPVLVVGDVMLDQFIWGSVARLFAGSAGAGGGFERESVMPGGAANVARNLTALTAPTEIFGIVGRDQAADQLNCLLKTEGIRCDGLLANAARPTSVKTRIVAHKQQVVRVDRETRDGLSPELARRLLGLLKVRLRKAAAVIVCDYGKGVVTQSLLNEIKSLCRSRGVWLTSIPNPFTT